MLEHPETTPAKDPPLDVRAVMASPTFCVYPWIEQVVQANGKMSYCCVADRGGVLRHSPSDGGGAFRAGRDRLATAWNSGEMRAIREAMGRGQKVESCNTCYFQESIGKTSYRQMHNREWLEKCGSEVKARIRSSLQESFRVDAPSLYLDLRLGNLCNLKCRSCNPYNSVQIQKETEKLVESDSAFARIWQAEYHAARPLPIPSDWTENAAFWDEVKASIPHLRKVYLTGGEPTLIQRNYQFLEACIASGHAKHIFLMFNVNGTNISPRLLEALKHFEFVLINVSLDGLARLNDYIRTGSRWHLIAENMKKLLAVEGTVQIGVTPVFQIYNVLEITALLDYVDNLAEEFRKPINVDFLYATSPQFLDARILPESVKRLAVDRLEGFQRRSRLYRKGGYLKDSVDSAVHMLKSSSGNFSAPIVQDFLTYTASLDRARRTSFREELPELHDLLAAEGFAYA